MKLSVALVCLLASSLFGVNTIAQTKEKNGDIDEYVFIDLIVEGSSATTDGARVLVLPKAKSKSFIKVRRHFVPQMLKSIEDI